MCHDGGHPSFFICNGELMRASLSTKDAALAVLVLPLADQAKRPAYKVET
jgi:hypothetical protein